MDRIRLARETDLPELARLHDRQGLGYPLPQLGPGDGHVTKMVLESAAGEIVMAVLARLTAEVYLLMDPEAGTPWERWSRIRALQQVVEADLHQKGLDDVHAFLPPEIAGRFGRRLEKLGWIRDTAWPCYTRYLKE